MKISLLIFWLVVIFCFVLNYVGAIDNENLSATDHAEYSSSDINQTNGTLQNLTHPNDNKTELNGTIISNQINETQKSSTDNISDYGNKTSNDSSTKSNNISNCRNETSLLSGKKEYFDNILLIIAFVVILISFFIIWAINRDIEGNVVPEKNYFWFWPYKKKDPNEQEEETTSDPEKSKNEKAKDKEEQSEVMKRKYAVLPEIKKTENGGKTISSENRAASFFSGLSAMVLFLIGVCIIVGAILFFLFVLKILAFEVLIYFFIFYSLVLFFTAIFTSCMKGYISPLTLGIVSGSGIFLILLSMTFSINKINFGIISIPTYMPVSSFFGVLAYIFVSLFSFPSQSFTKTDDEDDDNTRTKKFLVRFFAAIVIGIMVYIVLQPLVPGDKGNIATEYGYAIFGFASGFYINGVINLLRDKIFNLIGKEFFKEEERNRIIKDIIKNPENYITLQNAKITTMCSEINLNEEEIKRIIVFIRFIGLRMFKKLSGYCICGFEDVASISNGAISDIKNNCNDVDIKEFKKIVEYVKTMGAGKAKELFEKEGIRHDKFIELSEEGIKNICEKLKIDIDKLKDERNIFIEKCNKIQNEG